jgi:hypothetical protein
MANIFRRICNLMDRAQGVPASFIKKDEEFKAELAKHQEWLKERRSYLAQVNAEIDAARRGIAETNARYQASIARNPLFGLK